ncbi:hypothetical protein RJ640_001091 [Escallonia rubra]|uniref:Peptidase A1 domain-containing protein n=1 Tax=Escallonia rubra TaxID=112253 RepID=A0AA88QZA9_9ASTE|nr:hypothetical protein RJ640_001091 [Escallonia rubra]
MYVSTDVYERLIQSGKKPGFFQLLATKTVSAVWHVADLGDKMALRVNDLYLPICWKPRTSAKEFRNQFSSLVLSVKNDDNTNVRFEMTPESYLIASPQGNVCLAILNGDDVGLSNLNIIGDKFMLDKLVIYDYENKQIGWSPSDCKWKSNSRRNFLHAYYLFHVIVLSGLVVPMFLNSLFM